MLGRRRRQSERERTLLEIIRSQDARIGELCDRLAAAHGQPWTLPPRPPAPVIEAKADPTTQYLAL